jgi:hypothetical protein
MTGVDFRVVPSMSASYEQFSEVFEVMMSLDHRADILESPHIYILNNLRCTFS